MTTETSPMVFPGLTPIQKRTIETARRQHANPQPGFNLRPVGILQYADNETLDALTKAGLIECVLKGGYEGNNKSQFTWQLTDDGINRPL